MQGRRLNTREADLKRSGFSLALSDPTLRSNKAGAAALGILALQTLEVDEVHRVAPSKPHQRLVLLFP